MKTARENFIEIVAVIVLMLSFIRRVWLQYIEHILIYAASFFIVVSALTFAFWSLYPYQTLDIMDDPILLTPHVHAGGELRYIVDMCEYTDKTATLNKSFVDGVIYNMPTITDSDDGFGCRDDVISMTVPSTLSSGKYDIVVIASYKVNPIRTISTKFIVKDIHVDANCIR